MAEFEVDVVCSVQDRAAKASERLLYHFRKEITLPFPPWAGLEIEGVGRFESVMWLPRIRRFRAHLPTTADVTYRPTKVWLAQRLQDLAEDGWERR